MVVNYADLVSQLRATLGRMEVALGAIADAIVWTGKDGRVQWCNTAFDQLVNQPHILVLGAKLIDLLPLAQAEQPIEPESYPIVKVLSAEYEVTEYEFQQSDRSLVLEISGNCVDLGDGNPSAVLVIRDVTQAKRLEAERHRVEQEREEYLSLLRATLESTADGILVVDTERNVPVYNQKFLQIWSMPESLLLPGTGEERLRFMAEQTPDPDAFVARIWELFTDCAKQAVYDRVELKDGRIFERYSQPQWHGERVIGRVWSWRDITKRKIAEEALWQSEVRFRALFESAAIGCSLADLDGSILHVNLALQKMLGYSEAELRSMKFTDFTHPDDVTATLVFAQEVSAGLRESFQLEKRYIRKDGKVVWGRLTLSTIRKAEGAIEYMVALIEDISERKQAEAALSASEAKFRRMVENANDMISLIDLDGRVIYISPNFTNITGYATSELEGMPYMPLIHPDDLPRCLEAFQRAITTGHKQSGIEYRSIFKDGSWQWVSSNLATSLDAQGNLLVVGVTRDLRERKRAEEALQRSELKFRNLFENSQVAIWRCQMQDGLVLDANQRFIELLGYQSSEEVIGKKFTADFYANPEQRQWVVSQLRQHGKFNDFELQFRRQDGSLHWGLFSLHLDVAADCSEGVLIDISDRKQVEEALRQSESRYRALVTATAQSVFITNAVGEVVDDIPLWRALTGQSEAQTKGMGWLECIHPDDREPTRQAWLKAVKTGNLYEIEQRVRIVAGGYRLFMVRGVPVFDDQGNIREWVGTQTDITDRKRAEEALRLSELKYRNIFENSQVGIGRTRLKDGLFLDVNQRYAQLMGFSCATELIGKRFTSEFYASPGDRERILAELEQHGEVRNFEEQLRRPDGSTAWGLLSLRLNAEEGCLDFVIADISDRKRAEEALRRSELKYRNIFENSQLGIARTRLGNGLFLEVNQRFAEILGFSCANNLTGRFSTEFYANPDDRQRILAELQQQGGVRNFELRLRQLDGSLIWTLLSIRLNTEESCLESVLTDITDRKRTEAALQRSELKFRNLFENSQVGMFRNRIEDGWILDANQRAAELFGFSSVAEVIGKKFSSEFYANPDERQRMLTELYQLGEVNNVEVQVRHRDGATRWVMVSMRLNSEENCVEGVIADISARKQAEAILHQREQEFRALAENAPDVIIRFDRQSRYLYINSRVEREMGIPPAAFLGKTVREMGFSEAIASWWQTTLDVVFKTGQEYKTDSEVPFPQIVPPKVIYLSHRLVPEFGSNGSVESVLVVCRDITESKQAEEALQRRAQVDSLLNSICQQFIDQDVDTAFNFTLSALAEFMGAQRSCIFDYFEPQTQFQLVHEWRTAGIDSLPSTAGESAVEPFPWFYSQILSGNPVQGLQVSRSADIPLEVAGEKESQLLHKEFIQSVVVVPMIHSAKVVGLLELDVVNCSKTWSQEEINLLQRVSELIAIGRSRYQAEEALRVAKEAAESANRSKSAFLANMSHELRTPLNAILGFAQLMERDPTLTNRQRDSLATINRSGEHLLKLINDVLEMSKIEAGRIVLNQTPFDLHRLLQTIQEMFQVRAEAKQLSLQVELSLNLPQYILADEGKLQQVLINLLGNAIKFTDTGGVTLRVSSANSHLSIVNSQTIDSKPMSIDQEQITIHFEVEDTGRGIAAEELDNLFHPFVQTASGVQVREGTGLGLTISRQFVQLMGGDIRITSVVDRGSTFYFDIQVELAKATEVALPTPRERVIRLAPGQRAYRILVVDDRKENCDLLTQLLNSVGFETCAAANGQEAIAQWQNWHPHLIWMDMRMPVMDGYEATRKIRAAQKLQATSLQHQPTVIIALTASAFEEQRSNIFAAGCDEFIRKPFREEVIFNKMAEHLGVQYVYAEEQENIVKTEFMASGLEALKPTDLIAMPEEWVTSLHQAAIQVDADLIFQLIEQIPETHLTMAQGLADLVHHFCFDEIIELTQGDNNA